jgi:hypothetical protein
MTDRVNDRKVAVRVHLEQKTYASLCVLGNALGMSVPQTITYLLQRMIQKNSAPLAVIEQTLKELNID